MKIQINYEKFKQSDPFGKFNYLRTVIYDALADIWNVDGLDKTALESLKEHFESDLDNLLTQPDGEITDEMQAFLKEEKIWLETSLQLEKLRNASRHVAKS